MGYSFKNIATVKQFDNIIKSLTYAFFRTNAADNYNINYSDLRTEKPRFDTLKLILQAQNYKQPSEVMQEIIDKFDDIFAPTIANNLKNLSIRAIDQNEDELINDIEEGAEGVNIGQHTVEGMNISIKDNAPAEVKFFFQTIPDYEIGTDGRPRVKIDPITHFPSFVDSNKSWVNVLKDLSGCRTLSNMYAKVALLAKQGDPYYQALLLKLDTEINIRSQSKDIRERMDSEALLTKIETVVTSDVNNFVTIKISRDEDTKAVSMSLVDNSIDVKALNYPSVWSQSLFNNSGIFRINENGDVISSSKAKHDLKQIIDNLNGLKAAFTSRKGLFNFRGKDYDLHTEANIQTAKAFIVSNLNAVGIGIDVATLNKMFSSGDFGPATADNYSILNTFVTGTGVYGNLSKIIDILQSIYKSIDNQGTLTQIKTYANQTLNPKYIWNDLGIIKYMAQYYASVHATDRNLQSLGPDNTSYYLVSQNNFAKDRLNEIVNDEEVRQQLESVVYNKGSIVLDAARRGNKNIAIETFINFKDTTSQDTGRDYFGITDREDYIAKLTAILNNRLIFPTVADKKTYHLIRGLTLPHDPITLYGNSTSFFTKYGDQALDILIGYCYDELNQIELCLRQIDDDPNHIRVIDGKEVHINEDGTINNDWLEPTRRIKNFHTPNSVEWEDDKGNKRSRVIEGNGARFLFLTGIYTQETDTKGNKVKKFINFNDPMKSAQENLQTAKEYFFNRSVDVQKSFLSSIINNRVKQEIQTAKELGLITINDNNDIYSMRNVLLDTKVIEDRKQRYVQFDAVNAEAYAILDILSDYTINSIISIQEIEKLFSGAPAYYKVKYDKDGLIDVSIDKIKRLGSLTSTGINNRLDFFNDQLDSDEYTVAELKDHEIRDKQYNELEKLFTRGNIKEVIQEEIGQQAWDEVKNLSIKEIEEKYPEQVKIAKLAAKKDVATYKKGINVADAAVYISPRMVENLLRMRGVWSYDIKRAFDILSNPETADKWESDPTLYAKANKVVLNAMKYVAFGTRFDEIPGLGIPYFNKMALFPLFKSIATGDIKKLYDRMTAPGREIDMVMFNSAVKAGSRNPVKPYRQAEDSEIELKDGQTILSAELQDRLENDQEFRPNDYDKLVTYKQKYKYIRQQLETNPHTHEEQMLGTQFMKVSLSNLRDDDLYGVEGDQIKGSQIRQIVMSTLNKLSDIGVENIRKQIYNDNGEVDTAKLAKLLQNDAIDSNANDNVLSGLRIDENGDLVMPLDALSDNKWLESRFTSMISKDVIDVHMPGGAFIQRSAFGVEATAQDVITEDMINDGKPLLMINEEDGSMDSVVSINLFKHIIPNYRKMTFKQARQWLIDHNIIGQNAKANAIGYRIPTQSIASISALRFVDVFPEIMGDTIMLPEGFTKLTGSDFDIDKLYVARYSYDQEGNIVADDSVAGLKNRILQQYLRVLLTKDNTSSLKLSIDNATDNVKAILKDIEGPSAFRPEPFEVYSPTYQEARKAEYTGGKAGIGPFALNNAHHILTQLTKLHMVSNDFTEAMGITDVSKIFDVPTEHNPRGGRILDWLSAMINAFVDIAKDPYIVRLNVNGWTYNMVSFLLRTGKGRDTFYFMYQPILRDMAKEVLKTKGKYGIDRTKTPSQLENEAIERVLDKYDPNKSRRKKYAKINKDLKLQAQTYSELFMEQELDINGKTEYTNLLRQAIKDPMEISDFNDFQVRVYYAWKALKPYADSLANLVKYSKIDTKKIGKSFAEQLNYYDGMQKLLDDPNFEPGAIRRFYDETFVGHKTDNAILFGASILNNKLLRSTELFNNQKDAVLCLLGRKGLADTALLKAVISGIEAQIKSRFFTQYIKDNNIDITSMFTGSLSMAKRLNNFKERIRRKHPIVSHLIDNNGNITNDFIEFLLPNIENVDNNPDGLDFIDTSELLNVDQAKANNLINYWRELIEDPNPQISKLFKDLAVYAFITSGDNSVMNGFFQYLPNSFRISIGYRDYIRNVLDQYSNNSTLGYTDADDFFRNNWTNDKLVKPVAMYTRKGTLENIQYNSSIPNMIAGLRNGEIAINPNNWVDIKVTRNGNTVIQSFPIFPPYIKCNDGYGNASSNWHVYTLVGYGIKDDKYYPVYGLIGKKGYRYRGHTVTEYGVQTQFKFNKENEWNYTEAVNNPEQLASMSDNSGVWSGIEPITKLASYQNYNYMQQNPQTVFEEDVEDSETVLEEKDEPEVTQTSQSNQTINIYARANENELRYNQSTNSSTISTNTASYGVVIDPKLKSNWSTWQANNSDGIVAYRVNFNFYNTPEEANAGRIGNPFSENSRGATTVQKFMDWLITGNNFNEPKATEQYRQAIVNKILATPEGSPVLYYRELGRPSHATVIGYLINNKQLLMTSQQQQNDINNTSNADNYILHSGGAIGSDSVWGQIAEEYGIPNTPDRQMHYYNNQPTPRGNVQISQEDYEEGRYKVAQAAKANWGYQYNTMKDDRLIRNWSQVKYSDAIYAIGTMVKEGERIFPNQPGDTRTAKHTAVTGGTGYAIEMAIQAGKPVYVFDQSRNRWFKNINGEWSTSEVPTLTPNFAGIGTRQIQQNGINAIRDVFEKTFNTKQQDNQQNIQSQIINNTDNTNNDPVNFSTTQESIQIIESAKTILSNEELRKIRPYTGTGMPRIAVASEHTDPVFFSQRIIDILDGKLSVEDKFRNISYSGNDFAALYLITKHDGLPLKKLLEYKIPKIIHFSITGLGGTKYEPGVMKPDDLLDRIKDFIDQGLDPNMITVRIDPIIPGVTPISAVENIVKRASEMGIKNIRFSIMDQYSTTKQFMERLGYDYSKYYDGNSLHAKPEVQQRIANIMLQFKDKYGVNLSTCAEPMAIPGISKEACLSVSAVNNMLGTSIPDTATGKQRKLCSCYGGKTDLLRYDNKCASSCVYCYAHHNANANAIYYNQDGTLKDIPLTRTREANTQQTIQSMDDLVSTNQGAIDTMDKHQYAMNKIKPVIESFRGDITDAEVSSYYDSFNDMFYKELENGNLNTQEQIDGLVNKFICNL